MRSTAPSPVEIFKMKLFLLTVSLSVICYGANAQASECSMVPKSSDRLACYDRVTPPSSAKPAVTSKQKKAVSGSTNQEAVVDALAVENAKLNAKLKKICRGC